MSFAKTAAKQVHIVGAGVGGLAAAIRLLSAGYRVRVFERASRPGGKMRQISLAGKLFDAGPSVLTMPWVLDELCAAAGVKRADLLRLIPLSPICRHFFADGTKLDTYADEPVPSGASLDAAWERSAAEIARVISPRAAEEYRRFRRHAAAIYRAVEEPFLRRPIPSHPIAYLWTHRPRDVWGLFSLDARRSLWQALCAQFDDERLRMLFARYATYSGANPFAAPATLAVIAHVESAFGVYAVAGGMYHLAQALSELVSRLGGEIHTDADVERIELDAGQKRAIAIHVGGERLAGDFFIMNGDAAQLYTRLLAHTKAGQRLAARYGALPASLSAYLQLYVIECAQTLPLQHHNVFFSADYCREFQDLDKSVPFDPTIYICSPDYAQRMQRWFCLLNAPALPNFEATDSVSTDTSFLNSQIGAKLARHGISLEAMVRAEKVVTPQDFAALFPYSRGALYGVAPNSRLGAFARPPNRTPGVCNLYCVGGSTHPGAGVPMAMLSAAIVSELICATC